MTTIMKKKKKRINTHRKGRLLERLVKLQLEREGFAVELTKWSRFANKDFFNLWDGIALSHDKTILFQVKSASVSVEKYVEFLKNHCTDDVEGRLYIHSKKSRFRVIAFNSTGKVVELNDGGKR